MNKLIFLSLILLLNISRGLADCTCDPDDEDRNRTEALKFKLIALAAILVAGGIGVSLPFLGKIIPALSSEKDMFFIIKAFAAGVIMATGFIHVLPDAFESLTSPCLSEKPCEKPWGEFPFMGLVAMVATLGTLLFECHSTAYQQRSHLSNKEGVGNGDGDDEKEGEGHLHVHTNATHGHVHVSVGTDLESGSISSQVNRYRIVSKVLELGIIVHSVIIGLSLGASESPKTIKPLVSALTFHQFFEGMGLGGCNTTTILFQSFCSFAKFKSISVTIMGALFFTLTTPLGIVLGILVTKSYKENSPTALIVEGILNAASAGILIYMALVDLLSADFMNPKIQKNIKLHLSANVSLLVGVGCMTLLAKWA